MDPVAKTGEICDSCTEYHQKSSLILETGRTLIANSLSQNYNRLTMKNSGCPEKMTNKDNNI